jgi:hypothetical protein
MAKGGFGNQSRRSLRLGPRDPRGHRDAQQLLDETITFERPLAIVRRGRENRLGLERAQLVALLPASATDEDARLKINELIRSLAAAGLIEDPGG